MGCLLCKRKKPSLRDYFGGYIPLDTITMEYLKIPRDQFLCGESKECKECKEEEIPEILGFRSDNSIIEFICKSKGITAKPINEFIDNIKNSKFNHLKAICQDCNNEKVDLIGEYYKNFKYCIFCKKNVCEKCYEKNHIENKGNNQEINQGNTQENNQEINHGNNQGNNQGNNNRSAKQIKHKYILYTQKCLYCHNHKKESKEKDPQKVKSLNHFVRYCEDDQENCCKNDKEHDNHVTRSMSKLVNDASKKMKIIIDKIKSLAMIAKFYIKVKASSDIESQVNLVNSLNDEEIRDPKQFDLMMYYIQYQKPIQDKKGIKVKVD